MVLYKLIEFGAVGSYHTDFPFNISTRRPQEGNDEARQSGALRSLIIIQLQCI